MYSHTLKQPLHTRLEGLKQHCESLEQEIRFVPPKARTKPQVAEIEQLSPEHVRAKLGIDDILSDEK
ncbi:hypothetical protein OIV83_000095 [Microbotryomycetes sp. JL201]|nr:hypothetical protein OIV83_000095 [Microbotryomycetes sp. JL201]